jgi:hypothetical protein
MAPAALAQERMCTVHLARVVDSTLLLTLLLLLVLLLLLLLVLLLLLLLQTLSACAPAWLAGP